MASALRRAVLHLPALLLFALLGHLWMLHGSGPGPLPQTEGTVGAPAGAAAHSGLLAPAAAGLPSARAGVLAGAGGHGPPATAHGTVARALVGCMVIAGAVIAPSLGLRAHVAVGVPQGRPVTPARSLRWGASRRAPPQRPAGHMLQLRI